MTKCNFCEGESDGEECRFCGATLEVSKDDIIWIPFQKHSLLHEVLILNRNGDYPKEMPDYPCTHINWHLPTSMAHSQYEVGFKKSDVIIIGECAIEVAPGTKIHNCREISK